MFDNSLMRWKHTVFILYEKNKRLWKILCHVNVTWIVVLFTIDASWSIFEALHVSQFWSVDLFREIIVAIGTSPGQINLFHQAERVQCITRTCHLVMRWYSQPLSHLHLRETYDEHVEQVAAVYLLRRKCSAFV